MLYPIKKIGKNALLSGTAVISISLLASNAQAQSTPASTSFGEVISTATKREKSLQDTPIAVSVVSGQELEDAEIRDVVDLQSVVPSLRVSQSTSTIATSFSIRGFGSASNNAGIEPSVGVFVDGVYRSRPSAALADLINIERVEVLRGPQSTLFGKNASVGVVSFATKKPKFEFGGTASATYGSNDNIRLVGNVTGPLSDTLAFRLAASYNESDGYAENLFTGNSVNNRNRWAVQGQLLFEPSDTLSVRLIGDYDKIDEICCYQANILAGGTTRGLIDGLGDIVIEDPFSYEYYANIDPTNLLENGGVAAHINNKFDFADLTSITSYRKGTNSTRFDIDQSSADILNSFNDGETETFTQEFRLASNKQGAAFDWLLGAYYFDEDLDFPGGLEYGTQTRTFFDIATSPFVPGGAYGLIETFLGLPLGTFRQAGEGTLEERSQNNKSISLFGTADWNVSDKLTATVGLGYIHDEKRVEVSQPIFDALSQVDLPSIGLGALAPLSLQTLPRTFAIPNNFEDNQSTDDKLTYNVRLAYKFNDRINAYASYSTGFKATAWNLSRDSRPSVETFAQIQAAGQGTVNLRPGSRLAAPEESEVYEFGVKVRTDNASLNLAVFDQIVNDFQTNVLVDAATGRILANADQQSSKGIEVDALWSPIDNLTLGFAGTFLDPKYDSFPNSAVGDLSGQTPAGISKVSTTTKIQYDIETKAGDAFIRADWQHSGAATYSDNQALQDFIGFERKFDLFNASAGFTAKNGTSISVWGRNIFGEEYFTAVFTPLFESTSLSGFPNQPATYGVTVRQTF